MSEQWSGIESPNRMEWDLDGDVCRKSRCRTGEVRDTCNVQYLESWFLKGMQGSMGRPSHTFLRDV